MSDQLPWGRPGSGPPRRRSSVPGGRHVAVVLALDHRGQTLAVGHAAPVEQPVGGVDDDQVVVGPHRLVHGADQLALGVVDRVLVPVDRGQLRIGAGHGVLAGIFVTDLEAVGADRRRLESDLAVAGVGPEEGQVGALVQGVGGPGADRGGPVLVVTQAEQAPVVGHQVGVHVEVDVGPVGRHRGPDVRRRRSVGTRCPRSQHNPGPRSGGRDGRRTPHGLGCRSPARSRSCRSTSCSRPTGCRPATW